MEMNRLKNEISFSVIVPCFNASGTIAVCLAAILNQTTPPKEIIVVDDASTDNSAEIAAEFPGVRLVSLSFNSGAAAARNAGAGRATGDVLLFVDADVALLSDAIEKLAHIFNSKKTTAAIVGMYSKIPPRNDFYSIAHNYFTYFNHSQQHGRIQWFWGAIGAVARNAFFDVGCFDQRRYSGASAEDVELGFRLNRAGFVIEIDHSVIGGHLARFDLKRYLYNDFRKSALGVNLFLDENRRLEHRHGFTSSSNGVAVVVAGLSFASIIGWLVGIFPAALVIISILLFFIFSFEYLRFIYSEKGSAFTIKAASIHLPAFIAIALGAIFGLFEYVFKRSC